MIKKDPIFNVDLPDECECFGVVPMGEYIKSIQVTVNSYADFDIYGSDGYYRVVDCDV